MTPVEGAACLAAAAPLGIVGAWLYGRYSATRKAAKARAVAMYRKHSPRWSARHPERTTG